MKARPHRDDSGGLPPSLHHETRTMSARRLPTPAHRHYAVTPPWPWAQLLWLWLPLLAVAALIARLHLDQLRAGAPGAWLHPLALVLLAAGCSAACARRGIELDGGVLTVRAALFTRRVAVAAMRLDSARVLNLDEHTGFKPGLKKAAISYPGLTAGYCRTRGGDAGFYLLTDRQRALTIPLRGGGWLVLSPRDPRGLLQALRHLAGAGATP